MWDWLNLRKTTPKFLATNFPFRDHSHQVIYKAHRMLLRDTGMPTIMHRQGLISRESDNNVKQLAGFRQRQGVDDTYASLERFMAQGVIPKAAGLALAWGGQPQMSRKGNETKRVAR